MLPLSFAVLNIALLCIIKDAAADRQHFIAGAYNVFKS